MRLQLQTHLRGLITVSLLLGLTAVSALAQTTAFTYQGRLTDGGTAANGNYDLQFALFDNASGGAQIATQPIPNVLVSAGIFTVQLDFGASAFPGANRFLEISARLTGTGSFTTLSPRQQITSTPYAIRSLNASSADGTINATTQYNIGGVRILSAGGTRNVFVGVSSGTNTVGTDNAFFGAFSGQANTTGGANSFFGQGAGQNNTQGVANSFFGQFAGQQNTLGTFNSFFGSTAGLTNNGGRNAFFGYGAGEGNTLGGRNAFFGFGAGTSNDSGTRNTVVGTEADVGAGNLTNATAIGADAQVDQSNALVLGSIEGINGATSSVSVGIGTTTPLATLDTRGTLLVSGNVGIGTTMPLATLDTRGTVLISGDVGIGTTTATAKLDIRVNSALIRFSGVNCGQNFGAITFGNVALGCNNYSLLGEGVNTFINRPAGGALLFRENNNDQMIIQSGGNVTINGLLKLNQIDSGLGAGTVQLCRNSANVIAVCTSSSLRYKQGITPFRGGLELVHGLRPISFTWKMDGSRDLGLGAEDVAKVEPLLVTHNDKGEIEGVRYDRLNVILINAVKQQQEQIERQQAKAKQQQDQIARQQSQIEQLQQQQKLIGLQEARLARQQQQLARLKRLVCLNHARASICK